MKTIYDIASEIAEAAKQAASDRIESQIGYTLRQHGDLFGSEIEMLMMIALMAEGVRRDIYVSIAFPEMDHEMRSLLLFQDAASPALCTMAAQFPICSYRADFCMCFYRDVRIVIECDGHDHHERTKEQAIRDKTRDRAFQAEGFQVFRFTGREIWRNALKCAAEVFDAADREMGRRANREHEESTP